MTKMIIYIKIASNFFIIILMQKYTILNIDYIINQMPDQIKREFDINQIREFINFKVCKSVFSKI